MLDIKWIRENSQEFDDLLAKRGLQPMSAKIISLDEEKRQLITLIQQFQQAKNKKSQNLSAVKNKTTKEFEETKRDVDHINEKLSELNKKLDRNSSLQEILENLPNLPAPEVPYGNDASMNKLVRSYGIKKDHILAKQHYEVADQLNMIDFIQTVKMSGSRFVTLKGMLARLERALANFMMDIHTKKFEFLEISPPFLVREHAMYGAGQLPKFSAESFVTTTGHRLIPTSEVSLINLVADLILPREELPIRYVAHTPCFRSEAGSAGKDTRGMFRMHQFNKVELVSITTPDEAEREHEYILSAAEEILKQLQLPYRVMLLCTGDMGFSAQKTYDLEVWLPGQKQYREISSVSNCGSFQTRRMNTRYKEFGSTETNFPYTLNGSALALGRTMIAILETYQNEDNSITVPEALVSYMGGIDRIESMKL